MRDMQRHYVGRVRATALLPHLNGYPNCRAFDSLRLSSPHVQVEKENQSMADMRWRRLPQDALGHFLANYEQVRRPTPFSLSHAS